MKYEFRHIDLFHLIYEDNSTHCFHQQKPKEDAGAQPELDEEEKQEEHGQTGEQTEDQEGVGESESRTREEAHEGDNSALVTEDAANDNTDMEKPRRPGETDDDRTLGWSIHTLYSK